MTYILSDSEKLIAKQKEFVLWLKDRNMYSVHDSAQRMNSMFLVWDRMMEEGGN